MKKNIEKFYIISFDSTHLAIKSEKLGIEENLAVRVIPVPQEITADCGLALKVQEKDYKKLKKLFLAKNINFKGLYQVKKVGIKKEVIDITSNLL